MTDEQNKLSAERAAELLRLAVAQLSQNKVPATPNNYATWFSHVSGDNPQLSGEIERIIAEKSGFSEETNTRLYQEYVAAQDIERLDKVRETLNEILADVGLALDKAGDSTARFGGTLDDTMKEVAGRDTPDDIRSLLKTLVSATQTMQSTNQAMQAHFESKSREIEELQEELKRERERSLKDPLTGLYNRFALIDQLQNAIRESTVENPPSLIMLDIDHFKSINDTQGHLIGDRVIHFVAQMMQKNIKGMDTAARYGGEEFTILLPGTPANGAVAVAEAIRKAVSSAQLVRADNKKPLGRITISAGVATYAPGEDVMEFINRADKALYRSKNEGRNRVSAD